MAPPTVVLALHAVVLACLLTLADPALARLLQRPAVWRPVVAVNLAAMTLYLWHLPVLIGLTTLVHAFGLERPTSLDSFGFPVPDGWGYGWGSVPFWAAYALGVWAVVRLMWPFEHLPLPWWDAPPRLPAPSGRAAAIAAGVGTAGVGVATLMLAATGLAGFPAAIVRYAGLPLNAAAAVCLLLASGAVLRWAGAPRDRSPRRTSAEAPPSR